MMILPVLLLLAFTEVAVGDIPNYIEYNFTQVVDHFAISNIDTFNQRYLVTGIKVLCNPYTCDSTEST